MKTCVYIGTSLDGFIAELDGHVDWLEKFADAEVFNSYGEFMKSIDAVVIGRGTYDKVLTYPSWPYDKKVFVLSTTLKSVPEKLRQKMSVLSMQPRDLLKHLSSQGFASIYVDGGNVIQSFLREDCVDEMIISRVPVLLGKGIPLFGSQEKRLHFQHIQTDVYANGLLKSHYRRKQI